MKGTSNKLWPHGGYTLRSTLAMVTGAVVAVSLLVALLAYLFRGSGVSIGHHDGIDITPAQIQSIERIGEWEFLSIDDEELVDTVRHGFFGDSELVRIYYGTLHLGINLGEARKGWIDVRRDSVVVTLPPVKLLDEDFIDEARSRSFYEEGKWTQQDRNALYHIARARMKARCLTAQNIKSAELNAITQFQQLMRSMGFQNVHIRFDRPSYQ